MKENWFKSKWSMYILEHQLNLQDYNFIITIYQGLQTVIFEDQRNQFTKLRLISKMRDVAFLMRN